MKNGGASIRTHHFRLRVWQEQIDADAFEWRGQVTSIDTGDVYAFRTWAQLVEELCDVVEGKGSAHAIG